MKWAAWVTDPHLNFLEDDAPDRFLSALREQKPDVLLLGGDLGEASSVCDYLASISSAVPMPIYFVLGNHDYYGGSISEVRAAVTTVARRIDNLHYLPDTDLVSLTPDLGLVGHGGWGDARFGNFDKSPIVLNDHVLIRELAGLSGPDLKAELRSLGDDAADHVRAVLEIALRRHRHVFFLTHVPPFLEASVHEGRPSNDDWAPHFACKAVGDVLLNAMSAHPDRSLTVLCGHTHGAGHCKPLSNIDVYTGGTEYGAPEVQGVFSLETVPRYRRTSGPFRDSA